MYFSGTVPAPSRDEIMRMTVKALDEMTLDVPKALKNNFILNALDGSEDYLVRDSLWTLAGEEIVSFRREMLSAPPPKSFQSMIDSITPPEGVGLKDLSSLIPPDEGQELIDGEIINTESAASSNPPSATPSATPQQQHPTSSHKYNMPERPLPEDTNTHLDKHSAYINTLGEFLATHTPPTELLNIYIKLNETYLLGRRRVKKQIEGQSIPPTTSLPTPPSHPSAPSTDKSSPFPPSPAATPSPSSPPATSATSPSSAAAPTSPPSPAAPPSYNNGDYVEVAVPIEGGGIQKYRGLITRTFDGHMVNVQLMRHVKATIWKWPEMDDITHIPITDILRKCECPQLVPRSFSQLKFAD